MDKHVEKRIRDAMRIGSDQLFLCSTGRRKFIEPSKYEMRDHGPEATGQLLLELFEGLTQVHTQKSADLCVEDLRAWQQLLTGFMTCTHVVGTVGEEDPFLRHTSFSRKLRQAFEHSLHTNASMGLKLLGFITQLRPISEVASRRAWSSAGFYEVYEWLCTTHPDPSLRQEDALATMAYFAAYAIRIIEDFSHLGELRAVKSGIVALQHGAIPIAYDEKTQTVYVDRWHTL